VANNIKTNDTKTKINLSIKYIITLLLILAIILLISGFFEFVNIEKKKIIVMYKCLKNHQHLKWTLVYKNI